MALVPITHQMRCPAWLRTRNGTIALSFLFGVWLVGISVPLATLAAQHDLPLALRAAPGSRTQDARRAASGATILHVLAADCECSRAVAEHLVGRGANENEREVVWIVGDAGRLRDRLEHEGYRTDVVSADAVQESLGVAGAPVLFVYERDSDAVLYAGGYAPRRPSRPGDVQVGAIVSAVRAGESPRPHPAYGCIVGSDLRRRVDPLGLQYGRQPAES
jgi:hypothetical protein